MRRRAAWIWGSVAGVGLLGVLAYERSDFADADRSLESELAAARREGVPVDTRIYSSDVAGNAAEILVRLQNLEPPELPIGKRMEELSAAEIGDLRRGLAKGEPGFRAYERAAACPHFIPLRSGWDALDNGLPEISVATKFGLALALRATLEAHDGRPDLALNDLDCVASVVAKLSEVSNAWAATMRVRLTGSVVHALEGILAKKPSLPNSVAARKVLDDLGPAIDARYVLADDVANSILVPPHIPSMFDGQSDVAYEHAWLFRYRSVVRANQTNFVRYWREIYAAMPNSPDDAIARSPTLEAIELRWSERTGLDVLAWALTGPEISGELKSFAAMEAWRRVGLAAVDAIEAKLRTGRWPPSIRVGRDPLSGKPLRSLVRPGGFVVYSVGKNGRDDGSRWGDSDHDDLAFGFPPVRPEPRKPVPPSSGLGD